MIAPDVNVLVYAWNPETVHHLQARAWVAERIAAGEPLAISELVLSGAVRVLTLPGVRRLGYPLGDVLTLADELLSAPGVVRLRPGPRHWALFRQLCRETGAAGNTVPDCYHAALALEHGATWASRDRFFATVPGLDWLDPW